MWTELSNLFNQISTSMSFCLMHVFCTFHVFCFLFCLCDQDFVQFRGDHLDLKIGATKVICNNDKENDINSRAGYHQVTIFCPR